MSARIFHSYARSDGSAAAESLIQLLVANNHSAWQDLRELGPEETVWPQIEKALKTAEFLIVLITPAALKSDYIRKEWREARRNGATIMPVIAMEQSRSTLPRWLRRGEVYDLAEGAQREKFLARLNSAGGTFRADWDTGLEIETFVARPRLFAQIKSQLLSETLEPVSLTSALQGRGGYGKSVLAGEIARDLEIRDAYIDGVFWVSLGQDNPDVLGQINHLIRRISGAGGAPDVNTAAEELRRLLEKRDVLIILDDVWRKQDLYPFTKATDQGNATLLATTRKLDALPSSAQTIDISGMEQDEALSLLSFGLIHDATERAALARFAAEFWHWPQLLAIANGLLRCRLRDGDTLEHALATITAGARKGVVPAADERDRTIANVMQMGINDLFEPDRARFRALAVVPEDTAIPVAILAPLWGMQQYEAEEFARLLLDRRLIQSRDLSDPAVGARIRMFDDMLWYLRASTDDAEKQGQHAALLARHFPAGAAWADLDQTTPALHYLWRHLLWHLQQAGEGLVATALCIEYEWIKAKLKLLGIEALLADYRQRPRDPIAALLGNTLALSRRVLEVDPGQLGWQINGRLAKLGRPALKELCAAGARDIPLFEPITLHLDAPGGLLLRLSGHVGAVYSVAFSHDSKRIVSAGGDNTVRTWDATTGDPLAEPLSGQDGKFNSVAVSADGDRIVSGGDYGTIYVWEGVDNLIRVRHLVGHQGGVNNVAFSPESRYIVSGGDDKTLRLWEATTGASKGEPLCGHEGWVYAVAFSPDAGRVVSGSGDHTVRLWDVSTGASLGDPLRGHEDWVLSVAFSPDGKRIVSASDDGTLRLWDAATSVAQGDPLRGHDGGVLSVAFSPDSSYIVSGGADGTVRLWDVATGSIIGEPLRGHERGVWGVAFSPNGNRIVSGGGDGTLCLWDVAICADLSQRARGQDRAVNSVAFSPDGRLLVSGGDDRSLFLWDPTDGAILGQPLFGHDSRVQSVAFSSDSNRIVSGGMDCKLRQWDAATGAAYGEPWFANEVWISCVAFSSDGRHIVSGGADKTLRIWDATTGAAIGKPLRGHLSTIWGVAFSPDGSRIVSGSNDSTICLWDVATGEPLSGPLRGHVGAVLCVAFSADGSLIVSGGEDHTIRLWSAINGASLRGPLCGHKGSVRSVTFFPNESRIISGGDDLTLRMWDVCSGTPSSMFPFDASIRSAAASKTHIAVGDARGNVHILRWRTQQ